MNFNKISIILMFAAGSAFAQSAEIGTWAGFRKGAASFTFDDGAPSHVTDCGPVFEKYGYRATFNIVVNWNPNWSGFQSLADKGHEIASHSNTHGQNMSGEEASSKKNIEGRIKQKYGIVLLLTLTVTFQMKELFYKTTLLVVFVMVAGKVCPITWVKTVHPTGLKLQLL